MNKVKVLLSYIVYPLAMGTYFKRAFQRNERVDLKVCGAYTGSWIPWMGGMNLPEKYAIPPDVPLPFPPNTNRIPYEVVKTQLGDWKPDLIVTADAGVNWINKPQDGFVATIGTDPHVLDYSHARKISDKFFNMQLCYSQKGDVYLPYAYDPTIHYPEANLSEEDFKKKASDISNGFRNLTTDQYVDNKDTDAVLIGMPYENRIQWVNELRKHGVSVIFENSPVFDEYRQLANRARIGLNWSSKNDLNARFFETPAFGLAPVMNRVPDAHLVLTEGEDYLPFGNLQEAVAQVLFLHDHPEEITRISQNAHKKIQPHTYDARVEQLLVECGFNA